MRTKIKIHHSKLEYCANHRGETDACGSSKKTPGMMFLLPAAAKTTVLHAASSDSLMEVFFRAVEEPDYRWLDRQLALLEHARTTPSHQSR